MIITSIKAPHELYNWGDDIQESFKQFARRIGNRFMYINDKGAIYDCQYDQDAYQVETKKKMDFDMNGVFQVLGIERYFGHDLMSDIFKKIGENVSEELKKQDEDLPF